MSTLWTPGGERPVGRDPSPSPDSPLTGSDLPGGHGPSGEPTEEEMQAEMERLRGQLARTPAAVVIANHAFGLFELAALHLSQEPAQLDEASLAIDALSALVDGVGSRLGDAATQLSEGVRQLRLAFVQIHRASQAGTGDGRPAVDPG